MSPRFKLTTGKETLEQAAEEYLVSEIMIVIIDGEGRVFDPPAPLFLYFIFFNCLSFFPSFSLPLSSFFLPSFPLLILILNSNP